MKQRSDSQHDISHSPSVVTYELTRACDLACRQCRSSANPYPHPLELNYDLACALIRQVASFPLKPRLIFTGGDLMKRRDIFALVQYSVKEGLEVVVTPSATPLLTPAALWGLQRAGASRIALSVDGATASMHDSIRGIPGSFRRTLRLIDCARTLGLPVQVDTTITRRNFSQIDIMADLFGALDIALWSVYFLVPIGRGRSETRIQPEQYEEAFEMLWNNAKIHGFAIRTNEAHHYRRFVLQQSGNRRSCTGTETPGVRKFQSKEADRRAPGANPDARIPLVPMEVYDERRVMFVSHTGHVYPSGFLPISCGQFPVDSIIKVYQNSEVFQNLRNPDRLRGKCAFCEYRSVCGGSRARAYAVTRDYMAQEPDCVYIPPAWQDLLEREARYSMAD